VEALPGRLIYGTAWKEDRTAACVAQALGAGFRAIDTANQRKHYHEVGVGEALAPWLAAGRRGELWLQTKFTYADGQDTRLPYDKAAPVARQVEQSCTSSLAHLGVTRLDSLLLHGPSRGDRLGRDDHDAWRAMEALVESGAVTAIGISNVNATQVDELAAFARVAPAYVQNRCYASRRWDADVRAACARHGIAYQGFSLLTANRAVVASPAVAAIAQRRGVTPAQVVLRFAQQRGMIALSGTADARHARDDVALASFTLDHAELAAVERVTA
jgi:diketogulonate reductase-like aldo/keto reductase